MTSQSNYYAVYKVRFNLTQQDPDTIGKRYHTVLFVETNADRSGTLYHVTGDITSGMVYRSKPYYAPEQSQTFNSKEFLGYTTKSAHPLAWDNLLQTIPAPDKQKAFNAKTMKTEPFKTRDPLTFYEPGEARRPLFKCTEWTEQRAIPALFRAGLIVPALASSTTTGASSSSTQASSNS